jgi:hypothetical protein
MCKNYNLNEEELTKKVAIKKEKRNSVNAAIHEDSLMRSN